jgi:hypothetical protein
MDENERRKQDGISHHLSKKQHKGNKNINSRSVNWYGSINKSRGLRRKADRHSHHRRRKIMKEDIANTGGENIPKSMSTSHHRNSVTGPNCKSVWVGPPKDGRYYISNYKMNKTMWGWDYSSVTSTTVTLNDNGKQ